jgi:hypothetical protein
MANLFDAANSPTQEPIEVVVGDFIQWRRTDLGADYPNDQFTASYIARITGGGASEILLTGTAFGNDYLFAVSSAVSANFNPGYYHWQLEMVRNSDSERIVVDRGTFTAIAGTTGTTLKYALAADPGVDLVTGQLDAGGGALNVRVLDVQVGNSMVVSYDPDTGFATWDRSGSAALILI